MTVRIRAGSWPARLYPEDAEQAITLLALERRVAREALRASEIATVLERLARDLGWVRARLDGARRWVREERYWEMAERGEVSCYRHASGRHQEARALVSPSRRREIAAMGGRSAAARKDHFMAQLNVQIIVRDVLHTEDVPAWARVVQIPSRESQDGIPGPCPTCSGQGKLDRGEECKRCSGTGKGRWLWCVRAEPRDEQAIAELAAWIDARRVSTYRGEEPVQATVRLEETGGGLTNTGHAQIVCGLRGEPLHAVHGRAACGAAHAVFYTFAALVVSYSQHRGEGSGSVSFVGVDRNARHNLGVEREVLWTFRDGEDGFVRVAASDRYRTLEPPLDAIEAARSKARAYHCRSAYYARGGAHGPSGALTGAGAAWSGAPLPSPHKGPGIGYEPR